MVIADLKNKVLKVLGFSGAVQDQEFKFFKSEGVSSKTYPEAFMEWLSGLGFGRGSLQDRLKEYLSFLGFTGAIQDAEKKALTNGIFYDTIPLRVKNILSKYNATLLLPGPAGTVSYWFQPNNYRESTGQSLAAADQQVGLVVDAAGIPGPELVANGDFSNGTTGWLEALGSGASISVASGSLRLTAGSAGARAYQSFPTVVGRSYRLSITKSGGTATQSGYRITSDATGGATGQIAAETALSGDWSRSLVFTATASNTTIAPLTAQSTGTADFDNISVRELPGIHASQSTSGFQPYLRQSGGVNSWQFDGTDDRLSLSAVPFQPAENYFSVFGVVRNSDAVLRRVWEVQNVGIGGGMGVWLTNNTATFYASGATAVTTGVADGPVVITAKKLGNARSIQADNFAPVINTTPVTDHASLTCVIGNTIAGDRPYSGPIYTGILGKGAISDAEVQTLKRFVARLQGRNL